MSFPFWYSTYKSYMKNSLAFKTRMEQTFSRNKLIFVLYLKPVSVGVNQSVFLQGTELKAHPIQHSSIPDRQKRLKKSWVTVSPSCHSNDQVPELYCKIWVVLLSAWWCGPGECTAPPSVPAHLACFPLGISTCVGKGIDVCNLKTCRQNQRPRFCLSEVISTSVKWWLLSLIHSACRNLMEMGILTQT